MFYNYIEQYYTYILLYLSLLNCTHILAWGIRINWMAFCLCSVCAKVCALFAYWKLIFVTCVSAVKRARSRRKKKRLDEERWSSSFSGFWWNRVHNNRIEPRPSCHKSDLKNKRGYGVILNMCRQNTGLIISTRCLTNDRNHGTKQTKNCNIENWKINKLFLGIFPY